MITECRQQGCRMERDGFTKCETGKCIEAASKARSYVAPPPTAVVYANDAARGWEFAHCASEPYQYHVLRAYGSGTWI
jgi:hypothetical protein